MAPRLPPGRLGRAVAALAVGVAAGAWAAARTDLSVGGRGFLAGLAIALLAAGLVTRRPGTLALSLLALSSAYLVGQIGQPTALGGTALFAVALLVVLELAWWWTELALPVAWERPAVRRRWRSLVALAAGGGMLALVVGLAGVAGRDTSLTWFAVACGIGPAGIWMVVRATRAATPQVTGVDHLELPRAPRGTDQCGSRVHGAASLGATSWSPQARHRLSRAACPESSQIDFGAPVDTSLAQTPIVSEDWRDD